MANGMEASDYKPTCISIRILSRKEDILTAMEIEDLTDYVCKEKRTGRRKRATGRGRNSGNREWMQTFVKMPRGNL